MGLLTPNIDIKIIYIDKCKIDRVKVKVKANAHQKHDEKVENLVCIGVDGRTDKDTLIYKEIMEENGEKSLKKSKGPERHLTFTKEMAHEREYLTNWIFPNMFGFYPFRKDKIYICNERKNKAYCSTRCDKRKGTKQQFG